MQEVIDAANAEFWNELCGSNMGQHIGIKDHSQESLKLFDDTFFGYYPYFLPIVRPERMHGKKVLEIGLGFGSLGQKLAEAGADYTGLDIAANPVKMMNHRLRMQDLAGKAVQGNSLAMPFPDQTFDYLISIGCFHHTGNVQRCVDESYRVLKPGGSAIIMVYNKFSYRQWLRWPLATSVACCKELFRFSSTWRGQCAENALYDAHLTGEAAPETVFLSIRDLRRIASKFQAHEFRKRNWAYFCYRGRILMHRETMMKYFGSSLGLDLYLEAQKPAA